MEHPHDLRTVLARRHDPVHRRLYRRAVKNQSGGKQAMRPQEIYSLALSCGFVAKEQPDGTMDLNPYVYDFANAVISADHLGGCGPAMVNTLIRNRDSAEKKAAQFEAEAEQQQEKTEALAKDNIRMMGQFADQCDVLQSLRAVLKEAGVSNVDAAAPRELPGLVNYKIRHMEKYITELRKENHQLKSSKPSSERTFFSSDELRAHLDQLDNKKQQEEATSGIDKELAVKILRKFLKDYEDGWAEHMDDFGLYDEETDTYLSMIDVLFVLGNTRKEVELALKQEPEA